VGLLSETRKQIAGCWVIMIFSYIIFFLISVTSCVFFKMLHLPYFLALPHAVSECCKLLLHRAYHFLCYYKCFCNMLYFPVWDTKQSRHNLFYMFVPTVPKIIMVSYLIDCYLCTQQTAKCRQAQVTSVNWLGAVI